MRRFHDIGLRYPGTPEDARELVTEAKRMGFHRVCINVPVRGKEGIKLLKSLRDQDLGEGTLIGADIDVIGGSKNGLHNLLGRARKLADIVAVLGGDLAINKYAVESRETDVLRAPYRGRRDSGVDKVVAEAAARNGVALELSFADVLAPNSGRIGLLRRLGELVEFAGAFDTCLVLSSGAIDMLGLRVPQDLAAFVTCLGMDNEDALEAVSTVPGEVVDRALERKDERIIAPGVRVIG
ncbi:MAG: RNase P subunit p30 family protein [Candidatus Undinarchaeales archaeon]|jgi:ribonuclease P/MRP protein subunit RPP1|nr:RNase P subunit p30 family protein [Candidatus Undinarchaeales archaeon]MDP7492679.1 RNase P subunit p30 family protein [Candidatus Undinarchaeales archaeon]